MVFKAFEMAKVSLSLQLLNKYVNCSYKTYSLIIRFSNFTINIYRVSSI